MTLARHVDHQAQIVWLPVSGVQPVVYVAKVNAKPVAILELRPGLGYHLTTTAGVLLGEFVTFEEGEVALEQWMGTRARVLA